MKTVQRHQELVRRRVRIRGHVQGVQFRVSVVGRARMLGVAGWVRNLPDGSVEASIEGTPRQVEQLLEFCRSGPPTARVDEVRTFDDTVTGTTGFSER